MSVISRPARKRTSAKARALFLLYAFRLAAPRLLIMLFITLGGGAFYQARMSAITNKPVEFAEACYALAAIFRGTPDADRGRTLIDGWLARDPDLEGDEAVYALWVLGDNGRTNDAARLLAEEVATAERHDAELAIDLLDEVARRGLARDPRFAKAVNAAAISQPRQGVPGLDLSAQHLRAAAAYAYLRSR